MSEKNKVLRDKCNKTFIVPICWKLNNTDKNNQKDLKKKERERDTMFKDCKAQHRKYANSHQVDVQV